MKNQEADSREENHLQKEPPALYLEILRSCLLYVYKGRVDIFDGPKMVILGDNHLQKKEEENHGVL